MTDNESPSRSRLSQVIAGLTIVLVALALAFVGLVIVWFGLLWAGGEEGSDPIGGQALATIQLFPAIAALIGGGVTVCYALLYAFQREPFKHFVYAVLATLGAVAAWATLFGAISVVDALQPDETYLPGGPGPPTSLNERTGSYRGIAIGDPSRKAIRIMETPPSKRKRGQPTGPFYGGSKSSPGVSTCAGSSAQREAYLRFPTASFLVNGGTWRGTICSFEIVDARLKTNRGVRIHDRLAVVKRRYPRLRCGKANRGIRYCTGRIGRFYIWFGGDSVGNIKISRAPFRLR